MKKFTRKNLSFLLIAMLIVAAIVAAFTITNYRQTEKVEIGIAWTPNTDSEFYTNICKAIEEVGATPVMLKQVQSADVSYDGQNVVSECIDENDVLKQEYADAVKSNTYTGSNAQEAVGNLKAIVFTGGEDIAPTLCKQPEEWHGIEAEKDYNATRDISDYLLMSYCIDNDIAVMGFCRGMQMLSVVSGATVMQDIPTYFESQGETYNNEHRNVKVGDAYRDYAPHDVAVAKDSLLFEIVGADTIENVPSWHHQAIKSVSGTELKVSGTTPVSGEDMIEAVELPNKTFIIGLQFHPEAAIVKNLENADNKADFIAYDDAIKFFAALKAAA